MISIVVTDASMTPLCDPISTWETVTAEIKRNEVGAGSFTCPPTAEILNAVTTPGARVRLIRNGTIFCSGPIEQPFSEEWSAGQGAGLITTQWADDLVLLTRRVAYPNPALASTAQVTDTYTTTAVNAETTIRDIINRNVGPGALTARIEPHLTLEPARGIGISIDATARFDQLGDLLRTLAAAGGNLGVRVVEQGAGLVVQVHAPVDRSGTIRFSPGLNNLLSIKLDHEAPVATVAIVGGAGVGASRIFVERASGAATTWGRSETFVSSQATTLIGLQQDGDKALADKGEKYTVTAQAVDTVDQRFGEHFWFDKVTLTAPSGTTVVDVVSAAKLTATPKEGDRVTLTIGSAVPAGWDRDSLRLRELERRMGAMERT